MNILIVGEFSAFAKELKKGFVALGHQCIIFSWGDGRKNIKQNSDDYSCSYISSKGRIISILSRIWMNMKLYSNVKRLSKHWQSDAVLIINPGFVRSQICVHHLGLTKSQIFGLKKKEAKVYLSACGGDYVFYKYVNAEGIASALYGYDLKSEKNKLDRIINQVDYIIPTHYGYAERYRLSSYSNKLAITIPLPICVSDFKPFTRIQNNQIVVFLGKMRLTKGYEAMNRALDIIVKRYPNVKRIPDRFLSFDEYLIELSKANIVMDQCTSSSYGMNALYALSMGKCVLSGNLPEGAQEYGLTIQDIPIVDIKENSDMIVEVLEKLIINPDLIIDYGKRARIYAETFHDSAIIAKKYLDVFKK